jgi:hypothetical protein
MTTTNNDNEKTVLVRKGQYWAVRSEWTNNTAGDVVVVLLESVRGPSGVVCVDYLSPGQSSKRTFPLKYLLENYKRISEQNALSIAERHEEVTRTGSPAAAIRAARERACAVPAYVQRKSPRTPEEIAAAKTAASSTPVTKQYPQQLPLPAPTPPAALIEPAPAPVVPSPVVHGTSFAYSIHTNNTLLAAHKFFAAFTQANPGGLRIVLERDDGGRMSVACKDRRKVK